MSKHEHKECDHKLRICEKCDVVYCLKWSKEWGGHKHTDYVYPYRWPQPWKYEPSRWGTDTFTSTDVISTLHGPI